MNAHIKRGKGAEKQRKRSMSQAMLHVYLDCMC